jgi:hypothetical protein
MAPRKPKQPNQSEAYTTALKRIGRSQQFWGVGPHDPERSLNTRDFRGHDDTTTVRPLTADEAADDGRVRGRSPQQPRPDAPASSVVSEAIPRFIVRSGGRALNNNRLDPVAARLEDASIYEKAMKHADSIRQMMEDTGAPNYYPAPGVAAEMTPDMRERAQTQATRQKELTDPLTITQGEVPRQPTREEEIAQNREHHAKRKVEAAATYEQGIENIDRDNHAKHLKDGGTMTWDAFRKKAQKTRAQNKKLGITRD